MMADGRSRPGETGGVPTAEEMVSAADMQSWAFGVPREDALTWCVRWGADSLRVLRIDGHARAVLRRVDMGQWWSGRSVPMVGIAGVAVPPQHRGQGLAARLMAATVRELHEEGVPLSGLYPATTALYRMSGYEVAGSRYEMRVNPSLLVAPRSNLACCLLTEEGRLLETGLEASSAAAVDAALYRRVAAPRDGWLDRCPYNWARIRNVRDGQARGFAFLQGQDVQGYVWLAEVGPPGALQLRVSDMAALTPAALDAVLGLLRAHSSVVKEVTWHGAAADALRLRLSEQKVEARVSIHWMLRIVHVQQALQARGWPAGRRGVLHLQVDDDTVPANGGPWRLDIEDGHATAQRGGDGTLRLDIRGLAALYAGFLPAESLRLMGRLEADDATCALATSLFAGPAPTMVDMF